jgi:hypothetical protein
MFLQILYAWIFMNAYLNIVTIYEGLNIIRMDQKMFVIIWCCVSQSQVTSHSLTLRFIATSHSVGNLFCFVL